MSRKQKKKDAREQSTRQLMGIDDITDYGIATRMGELVFFAIKPTNISVLPDTGVGARIYALLNVVKGMAEIEMLALNSKESFENNKAFYPILSDLYDLIEAEYKSYDMAAHQLYTEQILREVLLGLHSMCKGADAQFFNGHTNITSSRFLVFGVKGLLGAAKNVRNAMLFNILSFLSDIGNTEYETVRLRRLLTGRKPITEPDAELLQSTVSKVRVTNNCVTVTLKNGQAIERRDQL